MVPLVKPHFLLLMAFLTGRSLDGWLMECWATYSSSLSIYRASCTDFTLLRVCAGQSRLKPFDVTWSLGNPVSWCVFVIDKGTPFNITETLNAPTHSKPYHVLFVCFWKTEPKRFPKLLKRKTKLFCRLLSGSICGHVFYIFRLLPIETWEWFSGTSELGQHPQTPTLFRSQRDHQRLTGSVGASCLQSESVDERDSASRSLPALTTSSFFSCTIFGSVGLEFME